MPTKLDKSQEKQQQPSFQPLENKENLHSNQNDVSDSDSDTIEKHNTTEHPDLKPRVGKNS